MPASVRSRAEVGDPSPLQGSSGIRWGPGPTRASEHANHLPEVIMKLLAHAFTLLSIGVTSAVVQADAILVPPGGDRPPSIFT